MKTIEGYDVKIFTDNIEENALEQIKELISIDVFSDKKIRIMPDVHAGAVCIIGFTGDLGDKVIPNIVGVDIGCGMRVLNLGKQVAYIYQAKAIKHLTAGADEFELTIQRTIEEYKAAGRRTELQNVIKKMRKQHQEAEPSLPADLCYVEGDAREQYLHDQRYRQHRHYHPSDL